MDDTAEARERLRQDFSELIKDSQNLLHAIGSDVDDKTKEAKARLEASLETAKRKYSLMDERFKEGVKRTDEVIHQYPYHTAGISFAFGVLLAMVLNKK